MRRVELTYDKIAIEPLFQFLIDPKYGGINTFTGTIREWTGEIQTERIRYSAYIEMAQLEMEKLAKDVEEKFDARVVIVHRLGELALSDIAVFIGVATKHRAESYEGSRYIIEQLKNQVPIWKEEFDTDKVRWGGLRDDNH
ncbi:molybdenum cofactor biosynthesis protein E [Listeria fleischmannii 1991]|uniref:Molybdopterin synthase catalytic subunit n=2 Tax=Listeria fleischmannii TaxID=1069827 RepID=A0A2X3GYB5_9LIST|nr:molybdenum cofactor biosynthesis protein MoaE [Listeria fleischmannii]KMT61146.1 molybdenum cofactor biosynthesis protein E [Listeria fleischmannii 1991]SQC65017.1 Molybdopterin synthase catalytic subunit [Listeria fleischmannii subsp. fleischmannii]